MKGKKILVSFLVIIAILGYVGSSIYLFIVSFSVLDDSGQLQLDFAKEMNSSIAYITSGLTGLVGSIVAIAFGVKAPKKALNPEGAAAVPVEENQGPGPFENINLQRLGSFMTVKDNLSLEEDAVVDDSESNQSNNSRGVFGFIYAIAYILIGLTAVLIWIINEDQTIEAVSHMATSFLGMMIPIVAGFFSNTEQ